MPEEKSEEKITSPPGYSWKFYLGFVLVLSNLPLGWLGVWLFFSPSDNLGSSILGMLIYLLSWIVLALGLWWVGKEYAAKIRRYITYNFYHESMKKGTSKVYHLTKERTQQLRENAQIKTRELKEKARNHTHKVQERVRAHLVKVNLKSPFRKKLK